MAFTAEQYSDLLNIKYWFMVCIISYLYLNVCTIDKYTRRGPKQNIIVNYLIILLKPIVSRDIIIIAR